MPSPTLDHRADLRRQLDRAGYYPELVADVIDVALADEPVEAHLVHVETTFATSEVRRHVTVLVLTASRLVLAHVDDHAGEDDTDDDDVVHATSTPTRAPAPPPRPRPCRSPGEVRGPDAHGQRTREAHRR